MYRQSICLFIICFLLWHQVTGQDGILNPEAVVSVSPAVGINTKHLEFAPVYYGNGIVFVQAKERGDLFDRNIGMPYFELMYADLDPNGLPRKAVSFSPNIRTRYHEGPSCFSMDEEKIYFTRSNYAGGANIQGADRRTNLKIYTAVKGPDDWENITELPFCSDDYTICHPAVTESDQVIFFSSDMPGGYGGMDLYRSDRQGGQWSEPVNLGPMVNTKGNEIMPYVHASGLLFFSSDGHDGPGRLDLYVTDPADPQNTGVIALPEPFNSRADDLGICIFPDGKQGFFSSSRKKGEGKDDIYHFLSSEEIILGLSKAKSLTLQVIAGDSRKPVKGASAWVFPIGLSGPEGMDTYFESEILQEESEEGEILLRIKRSPKAGASPMLTSGDGGFIVTTLEQGKDYLLQIEAPQYVVKDQILKSHVIMDIDTLEISLDALAAPSAEAELPAPKDRCVDITGFVVTKDGNAAVPFPTVSVENLCDGKVITVQADKSGRYDLCLAPECIFIIRIDKDGFLPYLARLEPADTAKHTHYLIEDLGATLVKGDVIVLENIYYDFNKSAIQKGAAAELDALVELMKTYPSMRIELIAHTDSRGTDTYNLELAERRAFAAKDYITARGIDASRIETTPMGEQQIRNRCVDGVNCSEREHQYNRRTEIKVLHIDQQTPEPENE